MKITIKTDPETLILLHKLVNEKRFSYPATRIQKANRSLLDDLFEILTKRCFAYQNNANRKKISLSLKYHFASLLYDILIDHQFSYGGIYEQNKLEMLKNELHQKLL